MDLFSFARGFPHESSSAMFGAKLWLSAQSLLTHNQRVVQKKSLVSIGFVLHRHERKHESSVRTFWAVLSLRTLFRSF
jgi:hypothetical protein